jgi:serine/threonine protein kinase
MIDGRSDLYSLGAVLYECLAGQKPYSANDAYAVALMHVTDPVPKLPEKVAWLQPLIEGLMAKNPDQRFATGEAFIVACDRLVQNHPQAASDAREQRSTRKRVAMPQLAPVAESSTTMSRPTSQPGGMRLPLMIGAGAAVLLIAAVIGWRLMHTSTPTVAQPVQTTNEPPRTETPTPPPPPPPQLPTENAASAALAKLDLPTLLVRGQEYLAYGQKNYGEKMDFPPGENAIDMFHEVLKRDSANAQAAQGLAQVGVFFEQAARGALKNGLYTATDEFIEKGLRADPNNAGLQKLKTELAKAEQGR